jgi:hypothetical protein
MSDLMPCRGGVGVCDVCGRHAFTDYWPQGGKLVWACESCLSDPRKWAEPPPADGLGFGVPFWVALACAALTLGAAFLAGYFTCLLTR